MVDIYYYYVKNVQIAIYLWVGIKMSLFPKMCQVDCSVQIDGDVSSESLVI